MLKKISVVLLLCLFFAACGDKDAVIQVSISDEFSSAMSNLIVEKAAIKVVNSKRQTVYETDVSDFFIKGRTEAIEISTKDIEGYRADEKYDLVGVLTGIASPKKMRGVTLIGGGVNLDDADPTPFVTESAIQRNFLITPGSHYNFDLEVAVSESLSNHGLKVRANLFASKFSSSLGQAKK